MNAVVSQHDGMLDNLSISYEKRVGVYPWKAISHQQAPTRYVLT